MQWLSQLWTRVALVSKSTNGVNHEGNASLVIRLCRRLNVSGVPSASSAFLANSNVGVRSILSTLEHIQLGDRVERAAEHHHAARVALALAHLPAATMLATIGAVISSP